jgi:hypothetical protein
MLGAERLAEGEELGSNLLQMVQGSSTPLERGPGFLTVIRRDFYRSKAGQDCDTESGVVVFNNPWRRDELEPTSA